MGRGQISYAPIPPFPRERRKEICGWLSFVGYHKAKRAAGGSPFGFYDRCAQRL